MVKIMSSDIEIKKDDVLKEFEEWKKENDVSDTPVFDVSSAGTVNGAVNAMPQIVLNSKANNLWVDNGRFISDASKVQGSPKTKHGIVVEHNEVTKQNATDIINGGKGDKASLSVSQTDMVTDLYIDGKPYQSKFYKTPQKTFEAFYKNPRYDEVGKLVPKDQYSDIVKIANDKAQSLRTEAKACKASGDMQGYQDKMSDAKRADKIAKSLKASEYTYDQSHHGKRVVATEITKNIVNSGVEAGAVAAITTAVISGATNIYKVAKGEIDAAEAIVETAKSTAIAGAGGFAIGAAGSALSTTLTQVGTKIGSESLKAFASGVGPTYVIVGAVEVTKSLVKYSRGELDGKGLAIELGEKALCTTISGVVGALTAELGPVSIVFSTAAYMATSALYRGVVEAIRLSKTAEEARKLLPLLETAYNDYRKQTVEFEKFIVEQTQLREEIVRNSFANMGKALLDENLSQFNNHLSRVLDIYGNGLKFKSLEEFDKEMSDDSLVMTI